MMLLPVEDLTSEENTVLLRNLQQLSLKRDRAVMRSNIYNTKRLLERVGFSIPPSMQNINAVVGWPEKTVDALSGRLHLEGFVAGSQTLSDDVEGIFKENKMALQWPQTQISTFIHGCAFVAVIPGDVTKGEPNPLILTLPATEATGIWNVRTRALESALWLYDPPSMINEMAVLFLPKYTIMMRRDRDQFYGGWGPYKVTRIPNNLPRLPVTPTTYRAQLTRPFGMSRLSRSVIYLCQMAARQLLRTEVSAEFFSSPQRWAMGANDEDFEDENGNPVSSWETVLGRIWMIDRDEEGDLPSVGQFPQTSMQPHVDLFRMITTLFAGETSLPVSSLGIIHDNPSSAAAIDAAWADMVQLAELCQVELGQAAVEIGQNVIMTAEKMTKLSDDLKKLDARWRDASTPTQAAMSDAVTKQIGAGMLQPDSVVALEKTGYTPSDIKRIQAEHDAARQRDQQDKQNDPLVQAFMQQNQQLSGPGGDSGQQGGSDGQVNGAAQGQQPPAPPAAQPGVGRSLPAPRP